MDPTAFCPSPAELALDRLVVSAEGFTVVATARRPGVICPGCGCASRRVHSRYTRTVADLRWHGLRVRLAAQVRRFFYVVHAGCRRRIFTERLPESAASYARRTGRAALALDAIGFAVGG
jgi:transposase